MWHTGDEMGWWMLWGGLMMVLFWAAIIAFAVWFVQSVTGRDAGHAPGTDGGRPDPLEIAKERFARGEMTREQFEEIRRTLQT